MEISGTAELIWAAGFAGDVALLLVFLLRRRVRKFPVFFCLIAYQALSSVAMYVVLKYGPPGAYWNWYWSLAVGDYLFQLALIWEIAGVVLRPTGSWVRDARKSFLLWAGLGLITVGALTWLLSPPTTFPAVKGDYSLAEMRATIFTSLLTCVVFLAMLVSANRLGLRWRSHVMALGQGLTVWAMTAILADLVRFAFGWNRYVAIFENARMFTWLGALGFWTVMFWIPERERAPLSSDMQDYLVALQDRVHYDLGRVNAME